MNCQRWIGFDHAEKRYMVVGGANEDGLPLPEIPLPLGARFELYCASRWQTVHLCQGGFYELADGRREPLALCMRVRVLS